ncbi:MAG TPA: ATP-dependent DNA helicase, partial [Candidatus Binatia bacterium]|nr:ATP-dependent DNA helicase [Candidatus Binatia bacterium]
SFQLEDVAKFLHSNTARELLVQALLDAPMFATRWRWVATNALAIKRMHNGKRAPPQFQRADSEDLLTVVFPEQVACAENLRGDREVPRHPLVQQTIHDCLHEVMDVDGFLELLRRREAGTLNVVCRDLTAPSPLAGAILNARPYAFLDDGDAEARRTRAVSQQKLHDIDAAASSAQLDLDAIERVRAETRPEPVNADELHDALMTFGFLTRDEAKAWRGWFEQLVAVRRATVLHPPGGEPLWVAAERLALVRCAVPQAEMDPILVAVPGRTSMPDCGAASGPLREIVRCRLELSAPVTEAALAAPLGLAPETLRAELLALEGEGAVMRLAGGEWSERRLLARIHRYSREQRRASVQAVAPAEFVRFLFHWQGLATTLADERREGEEGLAAVLRQLEGFSVPAAAWEEEVLPARLKHYLPHMLDGLCAAGRVAWFRPPDGSGGAGPVRTTPIVIAERRALAHWQRSLASGAEPADTALSARAQRALAALREHGASFFADLLHDTGLLQTELEQALAELVAQGRVSSDSFAGLRALILPAQRRERLRRYRRAATQVDEAGRWSVQRAPRAPAPDGALADPAVEHVARVLLARYGVVFRKLLEREDHLPPWRELFYVYRRLEARGEIRGGRFVSGFSGEQFALPDAAGQLRRIAMSPAAAEELVSISAADPLNVAGILVPGDKVPALSGNRVLFRNGVPVAVQAGDEIRILQPLESKSEWEIRNLLVRRQQPAAYLQQPGTPQ